jgi:hypothetical protein
MEHNVRTDINFIRPYVRSTPKVTRSVAEAPEFWILCDGKYQEMKTALSGASIAMNTLHN